MKSLNKVRIGKVLYQEIGPKRIDQRIVSLFLKQLSLLLGSGISLDDSLRVIRNQNLDKKLSKTLSQIIEDLDQGLSLSDAFDKTDKRFDNITLAFIKSGDKSGKLAEILEDLSLHMTEDYEKRSQIKEAFIYPVILLFVTILVVIGMMIFVLPTFVSVFDQSGQILPLSTRILIGLSNFIVTKGIFILLGLVIIFIAISILKKSYDFRLKFDEFLFKNPLFRDFRHLNMEYQIASLLNILKKGDIDLIETMDIIKNAFKNEYIRLKIDVIINNLVIGKSLSQAFEQAGIFSHLLLSMIKVGEDTGAMISSMEKTSSYLSNEYLYRIKKISKMAEPLLIIIMALIVGFVVFSVAIPMFDTVNNIDF
ncbi:MAG: type II secretion system F family protein [Peptoniphilaceae bacterium]|nr:type II secretion system F family protein [Peptoniphilaceae bacterium]